MTSIGAKAMIVCETAITTEMAHTRAFDYLADLTNAAEWHPSITDSRVISGDPGLRRTRYEMTAIVGPLRLPTLVVVEEVERPRRFIYEAVTRISRSRHEFTIHPRATGAEITTASGFVLAPALRPLTPLSRRYLRRFCRRSVESLHNVLEAQLQPGPIWIPGATGRLFNGHA